MQAADLLHFWFTELTDKQHFVKDEALDALIAQRFGATLKAGARCELWGWRSSPEGRLAEIIVLDQFSRNVWRDTPRAFVQDALALALAQELVARGDDARLSPAQRYFAYMPFMHSESLRVHEEALRLFTALGNANALHYEQRHQATKPSSNNLAATRTAIQSWGENRRRRKLRFCSSQDQGSNISKYANIRTLMNWSISYYNEKVRKQVFALPSGILADYIRLTDAMSLYGADLRMPHSRPMGGGLFELRLT